MNSLGIWLPVFFIWLFFDSKYVALFFFSHRMVNAPVLLIGQSIGKIFYSQASEAKNKGKLNKSIVNYFRLLFNTAYLFYLFVYSWLMIYSAFFLIIIGMKLKKSSRFFLLGYF